MDSWAVPATPPTSFACPYLSLLCAAASRRNRQSERAQPHNNARTDDPTVGIIGAAFMTFFVCVKARGLAPSMTSSRRFHDC